MKSLMLNTFLATGLGLIVGVFTLEVIVRPWWFDASANLGVAGERSFFMALALVTIALLLKITDQWR